MRDCNSHVSCSDYMITGFFFFSSRRRHTRLVSDWSSDVCSSDLFFISFNGTNRGGIARVNTTGGLDTTFNSNPGASGSVRAIAVQDDGKVAVGGGLDRKSVVKGKSVDLGGRRIIKKKKECT